MEIHLDEMYQMHGKTIHINKIWNNRLNGKEEFTSNINIILERVDTEEYLLRGDMDVVLDSSCSKCLQSITIKLKIPLQTTFVHKMESTDKEVFNNNDYSDLLNEQEIDYFSESKLQLGEWLKQEIYLHLPMKPVCGDSCLGLCLNCGINKNINSCDCITEKIDPRLAVLSELLKK